MELATLHKQHGKRLSQIFKDPAFLALRNHIEANHEIMQVAGLSPETIKQNGEIRFAQLQGFLSYANELDTILERKPLTEFEDMGAPTYPDPLSEITKK